jgi:hypothetical protein
VAEAKTKPSNSSVEAYLASRASAEQLADCKASIALPSARHGPATEDVGPQHRGLRVLSLEQLVTGSVAEVKRRLG